jgi:hypothetical protein
MKVIAKQSGQTLREKMTGKKFFTAARSIQQFHAKSQK